MKRRILFVDDDPNLLQGLNRMLRSMRNEWDMDFAPGGQEALAYLEHTAFDVVVSDVRMPKMNGVQLLAEVKNQSPKTIRILLSGQADSEMIMSAIGPAHQYLAKPCDPETLKTTIGRTGAISSLLEDERLKQIVSGVESMPAIPHLYLELEKELKASNSSIQKAAAIISKDVSMTAKILKMVNSAFFGVQQHISDPVQAVMFLGLDTLKNLVLSVQIFQQLNAKLSTGFSYDRFWRHSLSTAQCAQKIVRAEHSDARITQETLTAGLLHAVGMLLLASQLPDRYEEVLSLVKRESCSLEEAERQTLGATHAEIGAYLLGLWGLTTPIIEAVAFHQHPSKSVGRSFSPLTAVHVANALAGEIGDGLIKEDKNPPRIDMDYVTQVGMADRESTWRELIEVPA